MFLAMNNMQDEFRKSEAKVHEYLEVENISHHAKIDDLGVASMDGR